MDMAHSSRPHWGWSHNWEHVKKDKHWIASHSIQRNTSRSIRRYNQRIKEQEHIVKLQSELQKGKTYLDTHGYTYIMEPQQAHSKIIT